MFHSLCQQLIDEMMGAVLLHGFMRYRNRQPVVGPSLDVLPHLHSGQIDRFYSPVPQSVDLWANLLTVAENESYVAGDFYFASTTQTRYVANNRVWGRRWQPRNADRGVSIVGMDGIVQLSCRWFERLAARVTPRGIEVVMIDAPFNFRRTPSGYRPGQLIMGGDLNHQLAVARQAVLDIWTVIRSLQSEGRRVGLVGVSYGGWLMLITSLLAADLDFLIAVVPPIDIYELLSEGGTIMRAVRRGLGRGRLNLEYLQQVTKSVTPSQWTPALEGGAITLHAARHDRFVPACRIEALAAKWDAKLVLHEGAHYSLAVTSSMPKRVAEDVLHHWYTAGTAP